MFVIETVLLSRGILTEELQPFLYSAIPSRVGTKLNLLGPLILLTMESTTPIPGMRSPSLLSSL